MLLVPSLAFENATGGSSCWARVTPPLPSPLQNRLPPAAPLLLLRPPPPPLLALWSSHADLGVPHRTGVPALLGRLLMRPSFD